MTLLTLVVTLINCILIIIAFFTTDENTLAIFDILDKLFLGFYILEAILKILAYGIEDYFEDDWY
jgi:two pore calcium channel protein 1/two pore calcium channel protein 3